jgi:GT2 family glycosyltransferase
MADVSVIIVTHQSAEHLPECLDSLLRHRGAVDMPIVVSDSGSTDETAAIARRYPVSFLPGGNRGFAAANNRALAHSAVQGSRYVLFLNPDTVVLDGTVERLIADCDRRAGTGIFSVRHVDPDGKLIPSLFRFPSPRRYWLEVLDPPAGRGRGHRLVAEELYESEREFDWASGAFLLVRAEVLESIGAFDERFFFTSEEIDFCRRAHEAGWRSLYLPNFTILHRTKRYVEPWRAWMLAAHKIRYARKWFSRSDRLVVRAALVALYVRLLATSNSVLRRAAWYGLCGALGLRPPPGPSVRGPAAPDLES